MQLGLPSLPSIFFFFSDISIDRSIIFRSLLGKDNVFIPLQFTGGERRRRKGEEKKIIGREILNILYRYIEVF